MNIVESFEKAVANSKPEAKGVKVSLELFRKLRQQGLVLEKEVAILGELRLGITMYFYKDMFVFCDPELEGEPHFVLPPAAY